MAQWADIADLPEDERIALIGLAAESGHRVAFIVEDQVKANRYMVKLTSRFKVQVEQQLTGPVKNTISVIVTKRSACDAQD